MADRIGWHERAIEVHAFNECIDGQHLDAVALRLDDGRVVTDADQQPRWRSRQPAADARDQLALRAIGNRHFA